MNRIFIWDQVQNFPLKKSWQFKSISQQKKRIQTNSSVLSDTEKLSLLYWIFLVYFLRAQWKKDLEKV